MTSDDFFDEMKDINAPREIAVHTASALDQLVSVGNGIIERYHPAVKGRFERKEHHETYTAIEAEVAETVPDYNAADLQDIVRAYCNQDDSEQEAITRGLFTGALASVLTKRNRKKGERTHIHLTGDKNMFPYLLYHAHTLDELTIDDFKGDSIAAYAASYGGTANNITLTNITGEWAGIYIASDKGRVGAVTLANITGNLAGNGIANSKGQVDMVTLANITGDWAGANIAQGSGRVGTVTLANINGVLAGVAIAENNGRIGTVTLANITGDWAGRYIASTKGRVGVVTLANITGEWAGIYIASDKGRVGAVTLANITGDEAGGNIASVNGCVNTLLAVNNKGENYLNNNHATRTITALNGLANAQQIQSFLDELAQPDRAPEHYTTASKQLGELLGAEP